LPFIQGGCDGKGGGTGQFAVIAEAEDKGFGFIGAELGCGKHLFFVQGSCFKAEIKNGQRGIGIGRLDIRSGEGDRCPWLLEVQTGPRIVFEADE